MSAASTGLDRVWIPVKSEMDPEKITQTDLLHPELLPKRILVEILEEKHIKLDGEQRENKDALVEIFLRTVTPQPQRQPRSNRGGQITAKIIKKLDARRRRSRSESEKNFTVGVSASKEEKKSSQRGGLLMSAELPSSSSNTSRLKPPPITINKQNSVVKLNSGKTSGKASESSSSPTTGVRKLVISPTSSEAPKSTKLKVYNSSKSKETLPKSEEVTSKDSSKKTVPAKSSASSGSVSLKRPSCIENGEKPMDTSEAPPKPKIKRISWP